MMSLLELEFDPKLHVAGEAVSGIVLLDFRELQKTSLEDIHVKLRGTVFTYVLPALVVSRKLLRRYSVVGTSSAGVVQEKGSNGRRSS